MLESDFKRKVSLTIKDRMPKAIIIKMPAQDIQGIPDMLILYNNKWAALEFKKSKDAPKRPNQDLFVNRMNRMSFARFIYPENKEEVLNALERFLKTI